MTTLNIALVGNPNCGKTALFNLLTGSRQKVANYAGATVERKEGWFTTPGGRSVRLLDLPGAYSLNATSPDEAVTRDVCAGTYHGETAPDLLVCVADATNLRLHLRFVLEMRALGRPVVLALNMIDAATRNGMEIDLPRLQAETGMPVIPTIGIKRDGARALLAQLDGTPPPVPMPLPPGTDLHAMVRQILTDCVTHATPMADRVEERLDRWVLHPVWGPIILVVLLFVMFQAVFAWAQPLMDGIDAGMGLLGEKVGQFLPDGALRSLIVDGVIAGAGSVVTFLPQILILFAWILVLEESGYLPRAAFLLDRLMSFAGLSGRSFIPLLSSFACAVPGIMATRTIQNPRDRLITILIAPLMTCSARLPVYTLLIGAFVPHHSVLGFMNLQGLVLFGLYAVGILSAVLVALVLRWRNADRREATLLMELPAYRLPNPRDIALGLWERARIFLMRVGTTIISLTVLLWGLSSFPPPPAGATGPAIDWSLAGRIGHLMLPIFAPLGFNWQICVALIPGLAAREVAVGALATVYSLGSGTDTDQAAAQLGQMLPAHWSLPTALSLLAWYVYAPQCVATLAVIRRETTSWRVVAVTAGYLFGLAYLAAFLTYHIARAL
ncbi:ferrous iron transport protein B [Komagataeibacter medellinensis]|uniref:Ferrous iron transport protein B n=2 Tax=Komagataeibacter medellinensis TaxID=1177712 RepID=G2I0E2_KOMMN|nr:ferrous iron transport protein B [Komagataeibacter medellinensis]KAB8124111.1 ferrous iron transport protein B [Komagataeibacter medellinensis]BAK84400.1 ferrous iron transport protein B FeoB [Komagataeibacter medellinensis NBRC 3288]